MLGKIVAGKYELVAPLGQGGAAQVWHARHRVTKRGHAVKMISTLGESENTLSRFLREAEAFAHIRHPGVVEIFDAGRDSDGTLYLVMELLLGKTYRAWLETPGRSPWEGADLLRDGLEPLMAAHEAMTPEGVLAPLIHRDLKPENVFVLAEPLPPTPQNPRPTRVKLLDFGIARWVGVNGPTQAGVTLGTPLYASPEQIRDPRSVTARADVWSMGVMLHETFSGAPPFDGQSYYEVVAKIWDSPPPRLPAWAPAPLVALVDECLAKDPAHRPENARAMARRMDVLLAQAPSAAIPASSLMKAGSGSRAKPPPEHELGTVPTEMVLPLVRQRGGSAVPSAAPVSPAAILAATPPLPLVGVPMVAPARPALGNPQTTSSAEIPATRANDLSPAEAEALAQARKNAPVFTSQRSPSGLDQRAVVPASRPVIAPGQSAPLSDSGRSQAVSSGSHPQVGSFSRSGSGPHAQPGGSGSHAQVGGSGLHRPGEARFSMPAAKFAEEAVPDASTLPGYGRLRLGFALIVLAILGAAAAGWAWFFFPR